MNIKPFLYVALAVATMCSLGILAGIITIVLKVLGVL